MTTAVNGKICIIRNTLNNDVFVFPLSPKRDLFKRFAQIKNLINSYSTSNHRDTDEYAKLHKSFSELGSDWTKWFVDILEVVEPHYTLKERLYYYSIRLGSLNNNYIGLVSDPQYLRDNVSNSQPSSRLSSLPPSPKAHFTRINTPFLSLSG
jgi:hypothetical protein